jgi:2-haloalkanoic acid dehalogenase type II
MASSRPLPAGVKAIFFDFMGTCLDWQTSVLTSLPFHLSHSMKLALCLAWRQAFFADIHARFDRGQPPEDIDLSHARLLDRLLAEDLRFVGVTINEAERAAAVQAWHQMSAWPDVPEALERLREKFEVFVLANGTTRLQLDLARSAGLSFDMLLSSQLLGCTKPAAEFYLKALDLVKAKPEECIMVAAHAYDLRAAKAVGMQTVYIQRPTEDPTEDMNRIRAEVDVFVDGCDGDRLAGLAQIAHMLGAYEEDE